jgi:NitT/TauT family transport system permease protein
MIAVAGSSFQTDKVMVGILIISTAGMVMTQLLRVVERRFERWRIATRTTT